MRKELTLDCEEGAKEYKTAEGLDGNKEEKRQVSEGSNSWQSTLPLPTHSRHASSKYDFVKVRVWLGDNADHYYVLSRFLVSRMLTVTKIPNHVAIKISLELKKLLIDNSLLDVSQTDLEANLFKLMERRGYGEEYINRYKMMTRFHHQRIPLVILVCGTACVGKSTVATQLAQRLNLPNVLQTDMVYELIRTSTDAPLTSTPVWEREFSTPEELVTEFARECRIVRKGLDGDLKKAMKDGKPIIIEGIHLDPSIYLMDEESRGVISHPNTYTANLSSHGGISNVQSEAEQLNGLQTVDQARFENLERNTISSICPSFDSHPSTSDSGESVQRAAGNSMKSLIRDMGEYYQTETCSGNAQVAGDMMTAESGSEASSEKQLQQFPAKAIVVPIVLKMDEFDHKTLLEEWIACRSTNGVVPNEEKKEVFISKLMTIQDYLCSFKSQGLNVVNISATTFPQTLDGLHSYLLQCIEEGCKVIVRDHPCEDQESS